MAPLLAPGRRRRTAVALLVTSLVVVAAALARTADTGNAIGRAVAILVVSMLGFHAIALLAFDSVRAWRFLSYPSLLTSFMAVVTTLASLNESERLSLTTATLQSRQAAYQDLLYALKSTITNDCHPKASRVQIWTPSPEPYQGACDRMEHFLPQIEDAAVREQRLDGLNSGAGWGQNIVVRDTTPVGSWAGLYAAAGRFGKSAEDTQRALDALKTRPPSRVAAWAGSSSVKYWYFLLAFFLGASLAKATAEFLASEQAAKATAALQVAQAEPDGTVMSEAVREAEAPGQDRPKGEANPPAR